MKTKIYVFEENGITFILDKNNKVMVNATKMAKVFNKDLHQFTKSDHAKDFIESCKKPAFAGLLGIKSFINECLKKENSPFLNIEKEEELCVSRQKSGISAFAAFFIIN